MPGRVEPTPPPPELAPPPPTREEAAPPPATPGLPVTQEEANRTFGIGALISTGA